MNCQNIFRHLLSSRTLYFLTMLLVLPLLAASGPVEPVEPVLSFEDVGLAESGYITKDGVTNLFSSGTVDGRDDDTGACVEANVEEKGLRGCFMPWGTHRDNVDMDQYLRTPPPYTVTKTGGNP